MCQCDKHWLSVIFVMTVITVIRVIGKDSAQLRR